MKTIQLNRGMVALVYDVDYERVNKNKWTARYTNGVWYVVRMRKISESDHSKVAYLHREIMGCPDGKLVDHINGDGLDNRRCNLRVCTNAENSRNRIRLSRKNTSGHTGVFVNPANGRFHAYIKFNGKKKHIGCFGSIEDAILARKLEAKKLFGDFAGAF